jgi:hypothetical protein
MSLSEVGSHVHSNDVLTLVALLKGHNVKKSLEADQLVCIIS